MESFVLKELNVLSKIFITFTSVQKELLSDFFLIHKMAAYNRLSVRAPFSSRVAVFRPGTSDYTESGLSQQEESQRLSSNRSFFFRERKIIEMYFSLEVSERNGRLAQSFLLFFPLG